FRLQCRSPAGPFVDKGEQDEAQGKEDGDGENGNPLAELFGRTGALALGLIPERSLGGDEAVDSRADKRRGATAHGEKAVKLGALARRAEEGDHCPAD